MNGGIIVVAVLAVVSGSLPVAAQDGPQWSGYVRNYTGILARESMDFSIIQNTVNLSLVHRKPRVGFTLNPWMYQYPGRGLEIGLREAYLDVFLGQLDLRIGKQQIIWGKGEGVFITDIVSPKDMREFLLPDFEEIRIGVNALKAGYFRGSHNLELVWLPQFVPTNMPEPGSIWRREPSLPVEPVIDSSDRDIPLRADNGEVFGKYSLMSPAIDLEIIGGYMWDDDPTMHLQRVVNPQTGRLSSITLSPRHHRLTVGGAAFSTLLGNVVVRGEAAGYRGKRFPTRGRSDPDGVVEKDYINYLIGADYTLSGTRLSTQFIQRVILEYESVLAERQFENMATVLINRKFLRETLMLEVFAYVGLEEPDALVRPRVRYDLADGFEVQLGANVFLGEDGRFGAFDSNDMVYMKTQFSF